MFDTFITFLDRATKILQPAFVRFGPHQYNPRPVAEMGQNKPVPLIPDVSPTVSIVVPSFNQGEFLEQCLHSLLSQKYPQLELIVVDGGSSDGSPDILKKYVPHFSWWCSEPDRGQTQALNKGFSRSSGQIMAWLNSDDQLMPGTLSRIVNYFASHPEVDVVYGQRILIDEGDQEIGRWILPPHDDQVLSWADFIPQETLFWRREIWEKIGSQLDESFSFAMDWDLLLRFREVGARMVRLPYFMGLFRIHGDQKTLTQLTTVGLQEMQQLRKRYLGYVPRRLSSTCLMKYLLKSRLYELLWKLNLVNYR